MRSSLLLSVLVFQVKRSTSIPVCVTLTFQNKLLVTSVSECVCVVWCGVVWCCAVLCCAVLCCVCVCVCVCVVVLCCVVLC